MSQRTSCAGCGEHWDLQGDSDREAFYAHQAECVVETKLRDLEERVEKLEAILEAHGMYE